MYIEGELKGLPADSLDDNINDDIEMSENISKNEADEDEAQTESLERNKEGLEREVEDTADINPDTIYNSATEETITTLEYEVATVKKLSKEKSVERAEAEKKILVQTDEYKMEVEKLRYEVATLKDELSKKA